MSERETEQEPYTAPVAVKQEIENASERLTLELSKFSEEFKDLPNKLDNAFEFTLNHQTGVNSNLKDSYGILESLKKSALIIVATIGGIQFVADILVWILSNKNITVVFGCAIVLIPYGFLAYKFYSKKEWARFSTNNKRIETSFQEMEMMETDIFGPSPRKNVFSMFSEFKEKVLNGVKSVLEAAITFSTYGKLYRESLEYLDSLQTFKESFKNMLNRYNLNLPESVLRCLNGFDGDNLPRSLWIDSVVDKIDGFSNFDPLLLKLFYYETVNRNEENANILMQLKKNGQFEPLVNHLVYSQTITNKFEYPEEWISKALISVISENETFSLPQVRVKFESFLYTIQSFLTRFNRMISLYEINYPHSISRDFSPENISNFEMEYLDFLSRRVGTSKQIMSLLYYSVWDEERTNGLYKEILKKVDPDLKELSKFFLKHSFRTFNFSEETFSRIISSLTEFKLIDLRDRVSLLDNIVMFEGQYMTYLKNNNFPYGVKNLELSNDLISLVSGKSKTLLTKFIELSTRMINLPDRICERSLFHTVLLLIFLNDVSSPDSKEVNDEVLRMKDVLLALYKFIVLSQDSPPENRLGVVSDAVQYKDPSDEQDPVYSEFVWRLQQGQFIRYIPSLMSPMLKDIANQYKNLQSQSSYSKIDTILGNLFKRRIEREQVVKMLSGNLIESYLVTVPSRGRNTERIITYISDSEELREAQEELALIEDNPIFRNLVKVASAGTYTRIGIIPEGSSFPDFSIKFEKVMRRILTKLDHNDYPVYLTRVSASSQMTSVIMDSPGSAISPFMAIRDLAEAVLPREKLAALYAITNIKKAGKVELSDLIADIIDSDYGGIVNLIPEIPNESILSKIDSSSMELKREINVQLCEKFSTNSTTELCRRISIQTLRLGRNVVSKLIREVLMNHSMLREHEKKLIEEVTEGILDVGLSMSKLLV